MTRPLEQRTYTTATAAIAFARQGVAISQIVRALLATDEQIRQVCRRAVSTGELMAMPPNTPDERKGAMLTELVHLRADHAEALSLLREIQDKHDDTAWSLKAAFKLTTKEAALLAGLVTHGRMSKARIYHTLYGQQHESEQPEPKIVDVFVCKVRKKLPKGVKIETIWGDGYAVNAESAARIKKLAHIGSAVAPVSPSIVPTISEMAA